MLEQRRRERGVVGITITEQNFRCDRFTDLQERAMRTEHDFEWKLGLPLFKLLIGEQPISKRSAPACEHTVQTNTGARTASDHNPSLSVFCTIQAAAAWRQRKFSSSRPSASSFLMCAMRLNFSPSNSSSVIPTRLKVS